MEERWEGGGTEDETATGACKYPQISQGAIKFAATDIPWSLVYGIADCQSWGEAKARSFLVLNPSHSAILTDLYLL